VTPWVKEMLAGGYDCFYKKENGHLYLYDPTKKGYVAAAHDPRSIVLKDVKADAKRVVAENAGASLLDIGDGVLCLEYHSKANALNMDIFDMLQRAVEELEGNWVGMVIGNQGPQFCAGADLNMFVEYAETKQWGIMDATMQKSQAGVLSLRYCSKPVVAAPFSIVLGGGAEVMMAASAICAAGECYIGQVEAGVGVLPALGGCKELVRRVVSPVIKKLPTVDPLPFLQQVFELIAMAKVSGSAEEARQWGFLTPSDRIVMNGDHLLHDAKRMVLDMVEAGWRPTPQGKEIYAVGATGLAALEAGVYGFKEAGYITEHDALIANKTAYVLCGGKLSRPQWVDPWYILDLEREGFLSLLGTQKSLDRILSMLKTGKALRN